MNLGMETSQIDLQQIFHEENQPIYVGKDARVSSLAVEEESQLVQWSSQCYYWMPGPPEANRRKQIKTEGTC